MFLLYLVRINISRRFTWHDGGNTLYIAPLPLLTIMTSNEVIPMEKEEPPRKGKEGGLSTGTKITIAVIGLLIIILAAAFLTITVTTTTVVESANFPYTTTYGVSFPEGETITIGNTRILVLSFNNEMVSDVDGDREKLVVGEDRIIAPRHARVTTLGIPVLDTDFQILLKYKGVRENRAYFDLTVKTEKQVPDYLLRRLLPREIDARPI